MNHVTRLTLAAVLTISVAVLTGGIVLADVASDFEAIFGAEAKKVAASGIKADDAAFAAKLLKSAKKMPDSPRLQVLMYENACQFGSVGPAGCDTALEALALLERAVPAKKAQWRQRKYEIVKFRYNKSYGAIKKTAGKPYLEMLVVLAEAKVSEGSFSEAKLLYKSADVVATYIRSDRLTEITAKSKRLDALATQYAKRKSLQTKLAASPKDTTVREELILFNVIELDKPDEAVKLLTADLDESIRTYVSLAAKSPTDLTESVCLELGDWYYKKLFKDASSLGMPVVLWRAKGFYERFVKLHEKKDAPLFLAQEALAGIEKALKEIDVPAGIPGIPDKKPGITGMRGSGSGDIFLGGSQFNAVPLGKWINLMPLINTSRDRVRGNWTTDGKSVSVTPVVHARMMLPLFVRGDYELEVEFTRTGGKGDATILVPVHYQQTSMYFGAWWNSIAGLAMIQGRDGNDNVTTVRPFSLKNGQRYRAKVAVQSKKKGYGVAISFDGKPLTRYVGPHSDFGVSDGWRLPCLMRPALGAYDSSVTFHSVRFRCLRGEARIIPVKLNALPPLGYELARREGQQGGAVFHDLAPPGCRLVGFAFEADDVVRGLRPIYRDKKGLALGGVYSSPNAKNARTVLARKGYSVGGIALRSGAALDGFCIRFMRDLGDRLDPKDSYFSPWIGGKGGEPRAPLVSPGQPVIGVWGSYGGDIHSLALILASPKVKP